MCCGNILSSQQDSIYKEQETLSSSSEAAEFPEHNPKINRGQSRSLASPSHPWECVLLALTLTEHSPSMTSRPSRIFPSPGTTRKTVSHLRSATTVIVNFMFCLYELLLQSWLEFVVALCAVKSNQTKHACAHAQTHTRTCTHRHTYFFENFIHRYGVF